MDEKNGKKEEEGKSQEKEERKEEGQQEQGQQEQQAKGVMQEAKELAAMLKAENEQLKATIKQAEKTNAEMILSGRAPAGHERSEQQKAEDAAYSLVKGTGLEELAGFKKAK